MTRPEAPVRRLHRAAIVSGAARSLREALIPATVGVVASSGGLPSLDGLLSFGALLTAAAVAIAAIGGYVDWNRTTYRVDPTGIHLRRGVFRVNETWLPAERVQAVDVVRGPVQRLFRVVELRIQAAGGGKRPEIVLSALGRAAAEEVRATLGGHAVEPDATTATARRRIRRRDVVLAGVTSGSLGAALPLGAGLVQTVDNLPWRALQETQAADTDGLSLSPTVLLEVAAVVLVVVWLVGIVGAVVAFSGFTVVRERDRLRTRRGLLQRRDASFPVARVHAVRVVEGILRQPLGLAQVRVETAGYAAEAATARTLFPLLPRRQIPDLLRELLPELADELDDLARPPTRGARRYLTIPLLAALPVVLAAGLLLPRPWNALAGAAVVGVAVLYGHARFRAAGWALRDGRLVLRSRRLARTTIVAAADRLEERSLQQTPFTRRAGLATFRIALASRLRPEVAHVDVATARELLHRTGPR